MSYASVAGLPQLLNHGQRLASQDNIINHNVTLAISLKVKLNAIPSEFLKTYISVICLSITIEYLYVGISSKLHVYLF